jgi:hypothetical protein
VWLTVVVAAFFLKHTQKKNALLFACSRNEEGLLYIWCGWPTCMGKDGHTFFYATFKSLMIPLVTLWYATSL